MGHESQITYINASFCFRNFLKLISFTRSVSRLYSVNSSMINDNGAVGGMRIG
jgi:hypothetical protein